MNGSAPNDSCTGSHSCPITNDRPKRRAAGRDSTTRAPTIPAMMATKRAITAYRHAWKSRSPHTLRPDATKKARGRETAWAPPPRLASASGISARSQERLPLEGDLSDLGLDLLHHGRRERSVEEIRGVLLPVVDCPPQELHEELALGLIGLILVHEEPREARDGIAAIAGGIGQGHTEIGRHVVGGTGGGRRRRLDRGLNELARGVPYGGGGQLVRDGVGQLDIAKRPRRVLHLPGHAFVTLAPKPHGPLDGCPPANLLLPLLAQLGEVIHPDVRGAAAIGPMHDHDGGLRETDAGVDGLDAVIVPARDLAQEDVGEKLAREVQLGASWQVVGRHHRPEHRGDMEQLPGSLLELVVRHRPVGRPEVNGALRDLPDPSTAPDRLVVEPHGRIDLRVFVEPLGIDGVREGCSRTIHQCLRHRRARRRGDDEREGYERTAQDPTYRYRLEHLSLLGADTCECRSPSLPVSYANITDV